jgi:hypothetical protein
LAILTTRHSICYPGSIKVKTFTSHFWLENCDHLIELVQILHEWYFFHVHICGHQHDTSQNGNVEVESPNLVAGYPEASWEAIPPWGQPATLAFFSWHHHVGKIGCFLCTHIFAHHELPKIQRAFWHEDRLVLSLWSSMRHCNDWNQPICIDNWLMLISIFM